MALSGKFHKYAVEEFGLYCTWSGEQSQSGNYTDVTLKVYLRYYTIEVGSRSGAKISVNGETTTYTTDSMVDYSSTKYHNVLLKTKTVRVKHDADGTKTGVKLSASWKFNGTYAGTYVGTITASATVDLDPITVYALSTSADEGSYITVNRTSSGYGATGTLENGAILYAEDTLKVTFTPADNYAIDAHTVNGATFISDSTHTVSGDVTVVATSQVLASSVGATNAVIEGVSTVTVTKYNAGYYHSLQYAFGGLTGYITKSGGISADEVKFGETSVAFSVPEDFYAEIPDARTGVCTITCRTYSSQDSTEILGEPTTCTFVATATGAPMVLGVVTDTNETTIALTGDDSILVRYKSNAKATITTIAQNAASITAKYINGLLTTGNSRTFPGVSATKFSFMALDSREYSKTYTASPTMIAYIQLTLNADIKRPTPTGSEIVMSVSGNFYRGSFGAQSNTLTLSYRYKESPDGMYTDWVTIPASAYTIGTDLYYSQSDISIGTGFDYKKAYVFQVRAVDGTESTPLTTVTKTITVRESIPTFDWGKSDFSFNVPVTITDGGLTIGGTTISEEQLVKLLALIT